MLQNKNDSTPQGKSKIPFFNRWHLSLGVVFIVFGILITAQYNTQIQANNSLESQSLDNLGSLVISLSEKKTQLATELESLNQELISIKDKVNSGLSLAETLNNQIKQLSIVTGNVPITGPGISITITDDADFMYYDLIDLTNELFATGAEAVSINDQRIGMHSLIGYLSDAEGNLFLAVNGQQLLSPIVVKAIGNPTTLEKGLTFSGGIIDNFNILYQLYPIVKKEENIIISPLAQPDYQYIVPASH